jgi:hypothetical protein
MPLRARGEDAEPHTYTLIVTWLAGWLAGCTIVVIGIDRLFLSALLDALGSGVHGALAAGLGCQLLACLFVC